MKWFLSAALVLLSSAAMAQGVTTAEINGRVTDAAGDRLPGAVIEAVHEPTGTRYSEVARADGTYRILGMRVGGPYTVSAQLTGFRTQVDQDVFLKLSENLTIDFKLELDSVEEGIPR